MPQSLWRTSLRQSCSRYAVVLAIGAGWLTLNATLYALFAGQASHCDSEIPARVLAVFEQREFAMRAGNSGQEMLTAYRLMQPKSLQQGRKYPLVVFLHGAGSRGDDNCRQLLHLPVRMAEPALRARFPCFLLAPQCPAGRTWSDQMAVIDAILKGDIGELPGRSIPSLFDWTFDGGLW